MDRLHARDLTIGYRDRVISTQLDVTIPDGAFTVIVGPNACGKSTLLRALSRLLAPSAGDVVLDGRSIAEYPAKDVARRLGLLSQTSSAPDGISVADLVARGRFPHQRFLQQWTREDEDEDTFLDIAHQIELLELFRELNGTHGRTLVAVLHDLNHATRYGTHLIATRDGQVVASGDPAVVVTADLVEDVFGLPCTVIPDPVTGTPLVVPLGRPR